MGEATLTAPDTAPEPPAWLYGAPARAAFVNGYRAITARGEWSPIFASLLAVLANSAGMYVQLVREIAELPPDSISADLRGAVTEQRRITREMMVEHGLLDASAGARRALPACAPRREIHRHRDPPP